MIPEHVCRAIRNLDLDPSTVEDPIVIDGKRGWRGAGFLVADGCSGHHGWFILVGPKQRRIMWGEERFFDPEPDPPPKEGCPQRTFAGGCTWCGAPSEVPCDGVQRPNSVH